MSRMRQVPVMDITLREKAMNRNLPNVVAKPVPQNVRPRPKKLPAAKLRLSDAPALLSSGCSSVREFCTGIQHITTDLNQLVSSIENILPLLTVYMTALQTRSIPLDSAIPDTPMDMPMRHTFEPQPVQTEKTSAPSVPDSVPSADVPVPPMPGPEDIQQLLDNPLVKNLMNSFMQGNLK